MNTDNLIIRKGNTSFQRPGFNRLFFPLALIQDVYKRQTNYIGFIRRALQNAGMHQIPVVSINAAGLESNPGLKFTPKLLILSLIHI